eukprot:1196850-Amphidinium_carterae.2
MKELDDDPVSTGQGRKRVALQPVFSKLRKVSGVSSDLDIVLHVGPPEQFKLADLVKGSLGVLLKSLFPPVKEA